jgi:hypothetical protein
MEIEIHPKYEYKVYPVNKIGIFNITTGVYRAPNGWVLEEQEYTIIGETIDSYVYRLQESGYGEWVNGIVVERKYILPIGIHRTRFVKWKDEN